MLIYCSLSHDREIDYVTKHARFSNHRGLGSLYSALTTITTSERNFVNNLLAEICMQPSGTKMVSAFLNVNHTGIMGKFSAEIYCRNLFLLPHYPVLVTWGRIVLKTPSTLPLWNWILQVVCTQRGPLIWTFITVLTYWGRHKMDAISQTTFSNAFSWLKMHEFRLIFH